jgi:hypothetical protein
MERKEKKESTKLIRERVGEERMVGRHVSHKQSIYCISGHLLRRIKVQVLTTFAAVLILDELTC